jgi:hypothetical protein
VTSVDWRKQAITLIDPPEGSWGGGNPYGRSKTPSMVKLDGATAILGDVIVIALVIMD